MADTFAEKLAMLGFELPEGHTPPSKRLVCKFERRFGLNLPADFRSFLLRHGGVRWTADCPMIEPTPFGTSTTITGFYGFHDDEIGRTTDLIEGAPALIALGPEGLGRMFWLFCAEPYVGHVFVNDHYGRSSWTDKEFFKWPHLAPEIRHYLDLRRQGKLPEKPEGFENVYLVARSFSEFIASLEPDAEAAEPDESPDPAGGAMRTTLPRTRARREKEPVVPLPDDLVAAWRKAGAQVGWMGIGEFEALRFEARPRGKVGSIPAFKFSVWTPNVLDVLPAPDREFGLCLYDRNVEVANDRRLVPDDDPVTLHAGHAAEEVNARAHLDRVMAAGVGLPASRIRCS